MLLALLLPQSYADYESFRAAIERLSKSDTVSASTIAKSPGGRDVVLLTLGTGKVHEKPAIFVVGGVHGPHLVGSEVALRLARLIAEKGGALLERNTFYIVPRPNPDANEAYFRKVRLERSGNDRRTDDDRDGEIGEDPPDDLNGDGWITMMRVEDDTGGWKAHPDEPRVLVPADPKKNERGRWRLLVEGRDDDGDGEFNEDGSGGVSFNRNFPFRYPYFAVGAGPNQVSEPESRAVADFAYSHPNIAAVFTFTPEDNLFHPWKPNGDSDRASIPWAIRSEDSPFLEWIAERYREIHEGKDSPAPPAGEGSFSEWAYFHFGRWSFAARGWWIPNGAEPVSAFRWLAQEKIDGFVEWTEVKHPDFPDRKVEVGGFKPFVLLNPPAKELDPLAEKHLTFLEKLAGWMPRVRVSELRVEDLGGGVRRVTAAVVNDGYLPTASRMGEMTGDPHPLQLKLDVPKGVRLTTGSLRTTVERLAGNGGRAERSWLVAGGGGKITVLVWSPSVGADSKSTELK